MQIEYTYMYISTFISLYLTSTHIYNYTSTIYISRTFILIHYQYYLKTMRKEDGLLVGIIVLVVSVG